MAAALLARLNNRAQTTIFDAYTAQFHDRFEDSPSNITAWFKYTPKASRSRDFDYFPGILDGGIKKQVPQFDIYDELAMEMEWLIQNPDSKSLAYRFGLMQWHLHNYPVDDVMARRWMPYFFPQKDILSKKFNSQLIASRAKNVAITTNDPLALILFGSILDDEPSADSLKKLAEDPSGIGTVAALLYAGQYSDSQFYRGHPFNGTWLEQWIKQCSENNLDAAEAIFNHKSEWGNSMNSQLNVPYVVLGLFLKHHRSQMSPEFEKDYKTSIGNDIETFVNYLTNYTSDDDPSGDKFQTAKDWAASSSVWPTDAISKIEAITTTDPTAQALIAKVLANVRGRKADYPTGKELQIPFGGITVGK